MKKELAPLEKHVIVDKGTGTPFTGEYTGFDGRGTLRAMKKMTVVLDNVRSLNNVGSFFRTCDAFGIEWLVLCGITGTPPDREIHKTALGAEDTVPWEYFKSSKEAVVRLQEAGYTVIAVEQTEDAVRLDRFTPDPAAKYALVFGNEVDGISPNVLGLCDGAVEIPQVGMKRSLNVAVCGGAVLWKFFVDLSR